MPITSTVKLNEEADILYLKFLSGPVSVTREYGDHRLVDYDRYGSLIGIEFIGIEPGLDVSDLPERAQIEQALIEHGLGDRVVDGLDLQSIEG